MKLIEIRQGLFVNFDQIVSVRVLTPPDGATYAILQLSNGDKLNITREECSSITDEPPLRIAR